MIGTEVPVPGGSTVHEDSVRVSTVKDVQKTIEATREAFTNAGLSSAWQRVNAVVVQPGVEFGIQRVLDDYAAGYDRNKTTIHIVYVISAVWFMGKSLELHFQMSQSD